MTTDTELSSSTVLNFRNLAIKFDDLRPCKRGKEHAWQIAVFQLVTLTTGELHNELGMRCVYCREGMIGREEGPDTNWHLTKHDTPIPS